MSLGRRRRRPACDRTMSSRDRCSQSQTRYGLRIQTGLSGVPIHRARLRAQTSHDRQDLLWRRSCPWTLVPKPSRKGSVRTTVWRPRPPQGNCSFRSFAKLVPASIFAGRTIRNPCRLILAIWSVLCSLRTTSEHKSTYSITSSTRVRKFGDRVSPSRLAVQRFMTNRNLVGCTTGISAGFSPFSIRPALMPAW
jgi:hypothetical protein